MSSFRVAKVALSPADGAFPCPLWNDFGVNRLTHGKRHLVTFQHLLQRCILIRRFYFYNGFSDPIQSTETRIVMEHSGSFENLFPFRDLHSKNHDEKRTSPRAVLRLHQVLCISMREALHITLWYNMGQYERRGEDTREHFFSNRRSSHKRGTSISGGRVADCDLPYSHARIQETERKNRSCASIFRERVLKSR